jgi:hypothetical protein
MKGAEMNSNVLAQDLVRKAVIEVAQLEEKELLIVIEMVDTLKKQRARPNKDLAADILAKAKARAEEVKYLSRDEAMERFGKTLDAIREDAIAKGTAIDGELESD